MPLRPVASRASSPIDAPSPPDLPQLLTIDEVADLLRTTRQAIYARIRRGAIPGVVRLSRRILVDRTALATWLSEQTSPSTSHGGPR